MIKKTDTYRSFHRQPILCTFNSSNSSQMNYSMGFIILILNIYTWWSSLDVNYQTVIISSFVSLLILYLGIRKSERNRQRTKSIELTQYKQFIEECLTESQQTLDKYIFYLEKLSDGIIKALNISQ